MKRLISLILALTFVLAMTACGGSAGNSTPAGTKNSAAAPSSGTYKCKIGTGNSGGVFYVLGAAMAEVINKDSTVLNLTAQATSATSENIAFTTSKELDFAFAIYDVVQAAYTGTREYEKSGALDNVRIVMMGHVGDVCPIVFTDSPIQSLADLADNKYSIGVTSGYAGYVLTQAALYGYDIDIESISNKPVLSYTEQATALKDGTLDVQMYTGAHPGSAVLDSASTKNIRILGQTKETLAKVLEKYPYFVANTIPAGTYAGIEEDVQVFAVVYCIITHADVPDEAVTEYMEQIFAHDLTSYHAAGSYYTLENSFYNDLYVNSDAEGLVPFHPAAQAYLESHGIGDLSV